jgi:hypothetical protein
MLFHNAESGAVLQVFLVCTSTFLHGAKRTRELRLARKIRISFSWVKGELVALSLVPHRIETFRNKGFYTSELTAPNGLGFWVEKVALTCVMPSLLLLLSPQQWYQSEVLSCAIKWKKVEEAPW